MRFAFHKNCAQCVTNEGAQEDWSLGNVVDSGAAYWMGAVLAAPEEPSLVTY